MLLLPIHVVKSDFRFFRIIKETFHQKSKLIESKRQHFMSGVSTTWERESWASATIFVSLLLFLLILSSQTIPTDLSWTPRERETLLSNLSCIYHRQQKQTLMTEDELGGERPTRLQSIWENCQTSIRFITNFEVWQSNYHHEHPPKRQYFNQTSDFLQGPLVATTHPFINSNYHHDAHNLAKWKGKKNFFWLISLIVLPSSKSFD